MSRCIIVLIEDEERLSVVEVTVGAAVILLSSFVVMGVESFFAAI